MKSFSRIAAIFSLMFFTSIAQADHRTNPLGVAEIAEDLVGATERLESTAGFKFRVLSHYAAQLSAETEEFHHSMLAIVAGGSDHGDHHNIENDFLRVEADFWALARTWNYNAFAYSGDEGVLQAYNQVVAIYRDLLLTFYGIEQ